MRVAGLVAAHQHNGKSGTVCSAVDQSTGRVDVTLDEGGSLKMKPFNLVPIPPHRIHIYRVSPTPFARAAPMAL